MEPIKHKQSLLNPSIFDQKEELQNNVLKSRIYNCILDAIGNTPLVKVPLDCPATIYAKLEHLNPGGSIKDRTALYMIEQAEKTGLLQPGGTIIEASSGNQGIAAAMIGAIKGYRVIITVSEKVSQEKKETLVAYGAEIVVCKPVKYLTDADGYYMKAKEIHASLPGSFMLNQYFNSDNANSHYECTGREIWEQIGDRMTHFCGAMGSSGTVNGIGRYLKKMNSNITVLGVDSPCSFIATNGKPSPYYLDGMGIDYQTPFYDNSAMDQALLVKDEDAHLMLKKLARKHGFLVGPASGGTLAAIEQYAQTLTKDDIIVTIITDSGRAYLSKPFYRD
jgi:cystathionine beta-synthase